MCSADVLHYILNIVAQRTAKDLKNEIKIYQGEKSSVSLYDAAEGEVDWRGDQGRGDREADQLNDKVSGSRLLGTAHR